MNDVVNHPNHYTKWANGKIEMWDWLELGLTEEEFRGYLKGNILKYQRYQMKGGCEDLNKMKAYVDRLLEFERGTRTCSFKCGVVLHDRE